MSDINTSISFLGLGAMGTALAQTALQKSYDVTVWNRTRSKAEALRESGAQVADSVEDALLASPIVVVCLLDRDSMTEQLYSRSEYLRGKDIINLTTTSPNESREINRWAEKHGINFLDGGILAVPPMIGQEGASILYSGDANVFEHHRDILDIWASSTYFGSDAGLASLYDLALLAAMYTMFAGFFQGAAMVKSEGVSVSEFAGMAAPWLTAMTGGLSGFAKVIEGGDYRQAEQSLEFSDLKAMVEAAKAQNVKTHAIDMVQGLIQEQIGQGHGRDGFERIFESFRQLKRR
ncbi:NAD(P)-dependent oxidoreductase [Haloglycomyces albus]|uniref:NAD(P)-dependent oxidoreductase n=1 Tax=Haloglycomyces albus TaxID=526067 RepID=UPI00046CBF88|nr:NAD(P)-binding domain-containing protein [Haloglycomyces albus]